MAIAITLAARNKTRTFVDALWDEAARFERAPSMRPLGYPPHLTLAIYDGVEDVVLGEVVRDAFDGQAIVAQRFDRLALFDVDPLVLWAAPTATDELRSLHEKVHGRVDPSLCDPHYRPNAWKPHCTLAIDVAPERRADAIAFAGRPIPAFTLRLDVAEVVEVAALRVMETVRLREEGLPG